MQNKFKQSLYKHETCTLGVAIKARKKNSNKSVKELTRFGIEKTLKEEGYDFYCLQIKSIPWKSTNKILVVCHRTMDEKFIAESIVLNSLTNRNQMKTLIENIEELINTGKDKKMLSSILLQLKNCYYTNEHSLYMTATTLLEDETVELESFDITLLLHYFMDVFFQKAKEKSLALELYTESCFPRLVTGEKKKFEMVLTTLLSATINVSVQNEIKFLARLKSSVNDGFILSFELEFYPEKEKVKELDTLLESPEKNLAECLLKNAAVIESKGISLVQCKRIILRLKGRLDLKKQDNGLYCFYLELPFGVYDQRISAEKVPVLNLIEKKRVNEYTHRWEPTAKYMQEGSKSAHIGPSASLQQFPKIDFSAINKRRSTIETTKAKEILKAKIKETLQDNSYGTPKNYVCPQINPGILSNRRQFKSLQEEEKLQKCTQENAEKIIPTDSNNKEYNSGESSQIFIE